MDIVARLLTGSTFGAYTFGTQAGEQGSVVGGIVIFAVGIVVGLCSVLIMDRMVRRRMSRDHEAWLLAGRPERRIGERRDIGFRRAPSQH